MIIPFLFMEKPNGIEGLPVVDVPAL